MMHINQPDTIAEITARFAAYEAALMTNDVAALDNFFWDSPFAIRFGASESLFGFAAIAAFRAARGPSPMRMLQNTQITAFGPAHAVTTTEFTRIGDPRRGRQTQIWVKFPDLGWRITSAHVSWEQ
ncbi:MAG: oxalurate catabolism protein HpxZ [Acidocella sp.]|nr:oxalurate catabolism protein HpxZ [Acidocella sp.]